MAAVINKKKCTGCETCVTTCPVEAISIVNKLAVVDPDKCVDCGACVDACPESAITVG